MLQVFMSYRDIQNNIMFLLSGIVILDSYNSGSRQCWAIKLYASIGTCHTISSCFNQKQRNYWAIDNYSESFVKVNI